MNEWRHLYLMIINIVVRFWTITDGQQQQQMTLFIC